MYGTTTRTGSSWWEKETSEKDPVVLKERKELKSLIRRMKNRNQKFTVEMLTETDSQKEERLKREKAELDAWNAQADDEEIDNAQKMKPSVSAVHTLPRKKGAANPYEGVLNELGQKIWTFLVEHPESLDGEKITHWTYVLTKGNLTGKTPEPNRQILAFSLDNEGKFKNHWLMSPVVLIREWNPERAGRVFTLSGSMYDLPVPPMSPEDFKAKFEKFPRGDDGETVNLLSQMVGFSLNGGRYFAGLDSE